MYSGTAVSDFIASNFFYVFLGWLGLNVYQRRFHGTGRRKRIATLIQAVALFIVFMTASGVMEYGGNDLYLFAMIAAVAAVLASVLRTRAFPYRRTCAECGGSLDFSTILFRDDNKCEKCRIHEGEED